MLAAREGNADAQFNLGVLCDNRTDDNGHAIGGNRAEAIKWLLAAAEQGLARAQIRLAEIYVEQPDSDGSHTDACSWFLLARSKLAGVHRERAQSGYDRIAVGLSAAQITEIAKRVQLWKPTLPAAPATERLPEGPQRSPSRATSRPALD